MKIISKKLLLGFIEGRKNEWDAYCLSVGVVGQQFINDNLSFRISKKRKANQGSRISPVLTREILDTVICECPESGKLVWRYGRFQGKEIGHNRASGYSEVRISGFSYKKHRVVWAYYYGIEPKGLIDHINGNKTDNRLSNLRLATPSQNGQNAILQKRNISGFKGVTLQKGNWVVRINIGGKNQYFGTYKDLELAGLVSEQAREKYHGEFAKTQNI